MKTSSEAGAHITGATKTSHEEVLLVQYGCGQRHVIVTLGFIGFACVYAQRWNFSLGIISMVNHTAIRQLHRHQAELNNFSLSSKEQTVSFCIDAESTANITSKKSSSDGIHVWDEVQQGIALGAFFYGYVLTQVLGGWLSSKISAKWTVGISILGSSLFTLLTPFAAHFGLGWLICARVLIGLFQGLIFPAYQQLLGKWTPPSEATKATLTAHAGTTVGTVIAFPLVGLVSESKALGWQGSFYIIGASGCIWFLLWIFMAYETPQSHPKISTAERNFILQAIHKARKSPPNRLDEPHKPVVADITDSPKDHPIPWCQIITSKPVWAIFISHMTTNFGFYMILSKLPSYLKSVLGLNMRSSGFISGLPYAARFVTMMLGSRMIDFLRRKGYMSTIAIRKLADALAKIVPALSLMIITFVGCSHWAALLLLTISSFFQGLISIAPNMLDLSPEYAGIIYGISNTLATIPGMVSPYFVGVVLNNFDDIMTAWRVNFFTTSAIYFLGMACYMLMASATKQPWSY